MFVDAARGYRRGSAVAEGVETASDLEAVTELGFDLAQGYIFSRPVPRDDCIRIMEARAVNAARSAYMAE